MWLATPNLIITRYMLSVKLTLKKKEEKQMSNQQSSYLNKKGLTVKDLVTIGIFNALFFVFELIGSLPLHQTQHLHSINRWELHYSVALYFC